MIALWHLVKYYYKLCYFKKKNILHWFSFKKRLMQLGGNLVLKIFFNFFNFLKINSIKNIIFILITKKQNKNKKKIACDNLGGLFFN